ncbi:uncharacterized protein LOC106061581 [Biomphalaria glabrata]|uniref:Uncharacterized protein LOC106061581 n=1 Tax=Biomphalaria glabrata TaxID=6526 RepID=A0A9W2YTV6_BIOGL|nr:uncharacterized protein LOC106061581 [Biomphalaria glabrata]
MFLCCLSTIGDCNMATSDSTVFSYCLPRNILPGLAITFSLMFTVSGVEFCYYGRNIKSIHGFQNQSCSSGELHILNIFLDTEQQTTLTSGRNEHVTQGSSSFSHSAIKSLEQKKQFCYVFRYVTTHPLPDDFIHESVQVTYGCDYDDICINRTLNEVLNNVTINNHMGKLYCCSKDNCNDLEKVHSSSENRVCHESMKNLTSVSVGGLKSCQHADAVCAKSTVYLPEGKIEKYFCDNENLCTGKLVLGAFQSCTNQTEDNVTKELCCCDHSKCYSPPWLDVSYPNEEFDPENFPSLSKLDKTIEKPGAERTDSLLITGLLTVLLFVSGLGAGAVFILSCKKRRKNRQDPNVIMQYERLSSDIDVDEAVVL